MGTAIVNRPTEAAALGAVSSQRRIQTPPSVNRLADLLIVARATGDRYGAQLFGCLLDRALGSTS
ncbi:hypothetical protein [Streptomyces brevispora]|uniref:hypothetical protein n=1 Tax=Streptomyces brevispora TaxID=887462 RepID=UPI0035E194EC